MCRIFKISKSNNQKSNLIDINQYKSMDENEIPKEMFKDLMQNSLDIVRTEVDYHNTKF